MKAGQTSARIVIERPQAEALTSMKVATWPIWTKEPSTFEWHYDEPETCYFLEGDVTVTSAGEEVVLRPGDLVRFPQGLHCTWHIRQAVRKHYRFGSSAP